LIHRVCLEIIGDDASEKGLMGDVLIEGKAFHLADLTDIEIETYVIHILYLLSACFSGARYLILNLVRVITTHLNISYFPGFVNPSGSSFSGILGDTVFGELDILSRSVYTDRVQAETFTDQRDCARAAEGIENPATHRVALPTTGTSGKPANRLCSVYIFLATLPSCLPE